MRFAKIFLILTFLSSSATSQISNFININYRYLIPQFETKKLYGSSSSLGLEYNKNLKSYFYSVDCNYEFGNKINDSLVLENITTNNNQIISSDGSFANILLYKRGFFSHVSIGKIIKSGKSKKTGFYPSFGIGYSQSKILIETRNQYIPFLNDEYKKGYDKKRGGFSTKLGLDFRYFNRKNNWKFIVGSELIHCLNKNYRRYFYSDQSFSNNNLKNDLLFSLKFGLIIQVNRTNNEKFHYF
tara:strand:+ start:4897 stop:5622 length:726 start_codon:yes stop_codon:yes gene_type:complete